ELDLNAPPSAAITQPDAAYPGLLGPWRASLERCKHAVLTLLGTTAQTLGAELRQAQMITMPLADMMIELYHAESALLRTEKMLTRGESAEAEMAMTQLSIHEMAARIYKSGKELLPALFEGEEIAEEEERLRRWTAVPEGKVWEMRASLV
ncbi:MAG: acyl-CoA dehydrogenase family protein, partial [Bacteroidota bacterium]